MKIPVFSLDYRLAPNDPYPAAFDDCWQAYNWLLNCAGDALSKMKNYNTYSLNETFLDLRFKKIILAGDSAGGNLALGNLILRVYLISKSNHLLGHKEKNESSRWANVGISR